MGYLRKEDQAAAARRHYERNRPLVIARAKAARQAQVVRLHALVVEAKRVPCVDCGGRFPACAMDFDHAGQPKDRAVAEMVSAAVSVERLLREMAKCVVVCSNCHRVRSEGERLERAGSSSSAGVVDARVVLPGFEATYEPA